jgi:heme/copper-type cytochrome/quinol oxidase subunit 3
MAVFLAAEATLFGAILGSYFYLRFNTPRWPPSGTPAPDLLLPVVLTSLLITTSAPVQAALGFARRGLRGRAWWALLLATAVQTTYLGVQIHLMGDDLAQFTPRTSAYASIYYVLIGAGHAHVLFGVLLDIWLLTRLGTRLTRYRLVALQVTALYWHVINGLTVLVLLTQLSPRL